MMLILFIIMVLLFLFDDDPAISGIGAVVLGLLIYMFY